ncbi:MAG: nucleotide-binding protein [Burkholderiaceae bacterium]|nr:nucleotide-binding protein [Burkholderiaceae bacterium]
MMSSQIDMFSQINNAVLDLQSSQLQTYERPLKTLVRLLQHPSLVEINRTLVERVDFDAFIAASEKTGGSMVGSHKLAWSEDQIKNIGLTLILLEKLSQDSSFTINFTHHYYRSGNKVIAGIHEMIRQLIIPFVRDYKAYVMNNGDVEPKIIGPKSNNVFIVHGHDGEARESVARFLGNIGLTPIILYEQANRGRTVIEKVEAHSEVGFAVVLLTADDEGRVKGATELEPRARQNVLLELGYFIGRLGRENVCALKRGTLEIPSDFAGVVWETMDAGAGWKQVLGRELSAAGYEIDWNKVMRP